MSDLISRQAAIDAVKSRKTAEQSSAGIMRNAVVDFCVDIIKKLPSVQPQPVVRCKDCKWGAQDEDGWWYCVEIGGHMGDGEKGDGFCSDAERRTDGKNT